MIEEIIETLMVLIIQYPGAFIRWMLTGFKKGRFKEFTSDDPYRNSMVVIIAFIVVGLLIYFI